MPRRQVPGVVERLDDRSTRRRGRDARRAAVDRERGDGARHVAIESASFDGRLRHAIKGSEAPTALGFSTTTRASRAPRFRSPKRPSIRSGWPVSRAGSPTPRSQLFCDDVDGGLFYSPSDGEVVLHRTKEIHDHAYPGGVGMIARTRCSRLATLTGVIRYRTTVDRLLSTIAAAANPMAVGTLVRASIGPRAVRSRSSSSAIRIAVTLARDVARGAKAFTCPHRSLVCVANEAEGSRHGLDAALLEGRTAARAAHLRVRLPRHRAMSVIDAERTGRNAATRGSGVATRSPLPSGLSALAFLPATGGVSR